MGLNMNAFEADFVAFVNKRESGNLNRTFVYLSAGTVAIHLALLNCDVDPYDEMQV